MARAPDPRIEQAKTLYKKGMKDATKLFQENGNSFVTYIRKK